MDLCQEPENYTSEPESDHNQVSEEGYESEEEGVLEKSPGDQPFTGDQSPVKNKPTHLFTSTRNFGAPPPDTQIVFQNRAIFNGLVTELNYVDVKLRLNARVEKGTVWTYIGKSFKSVVSKAGAGGANIVVRAVIHVKKFLPVAFLFCFF
jgi:hypothetical protein